jgi:beta-lactamase class A
VPVAGRIGRSPALTLRDRTVVAPAGRPWPVRRRASRGRRAFPRPLLLAGLVLALLLAWRWWPAAGAPAPRPTPVTASPATGTLPSAALLSDVIPALPPARPDGGLQAIVEQAIDRGNGSTGVVVRHLSSGASAAHRAQEVFPAASLAKVPILVEVYRQLAAGTLRADEAVEITAESITAGAGVLQAQVGERRSLAELIQLSVTVSDNVAARLLLQRVGGVAAVNRTMAALGLSQTRLYDDERPNTTTAEEMATLFAWIATRAPLGDGRQATMLRGVTTPTGLAALFALSQAQAWLTEGVPPGVTVAHKSGQLPGVRHNAGIVYTPKGPYVIVVLTGDLADQGEAEAFIARLARLTYGHLTR